MTQPPNQPPQPPSQPPNQPSQGGFGAPQPPAQPPQAPPAPQGPPPAAPPGAPGYGYPQQPPAQAGYGYPQQAPGQPGPYNQPGPYGQQAGPYGSYPTQPQYPGAPTPPGGGSGGGNFFKGRPGVIIGAAVAGLLVIGGGTYLALSGGDDKKDEKNVSKSDDPKPTGSASVDQGDGSGDGRDGDDDLNAGRKPGEAKVLFLSKNDVDLPRNGAEVFGPWVAGDTVVKAMYKEVVGYSVTDGKKKWTVPLSAEVCSAAPQTSADGKIVVGVKDGLTEKAKCLKLQMIDINTGKAGWTKPIPKAGGPFGSLSDFTLSISGNTLAAGGSGNSYGFSLADGKQLFKGPSEGCKPGAFAGGPKLLTVASCPTSDYDKPKQQLSEVDPATGKARWTYNAPVGWEIDKVYSVSPPVISLTQREPKKWSIVALTDNGRLRSQIQGGKDKFAPRCGGAFVVFGHNLEGCTGVAADASTFYMSTETAYGTANEVVAFSLDTGKEKWRSPAGGKHKMTPLRMESGSVLVYVDASYDAGGAVATIAPTGGAPKVLLQHPASTAEIESSFFSSKMAYADGRFFIASGRVSASNDKEEKETKTMMAFGK
ncbi:outer membrane protein assembly factor BamB [Streptomyces sp. SLBN-118]|uniref:outer membrane protein assembly factor BamB family protein n=1 Tax=Streptomyces sp. SLBN-118 TaxID=2768454 RepID=UPI00114EF913|nr:PQQ-binding-like beta-propeller repeat protein [Streptomyces sp. SLBN-118]TQK45075.1 outer membrane protein assembly factor BamB [Streptomyces sp. SLBN-118]